MLKFMYITNQPEIAIIAEEVGVDYIWIDLERLGKKKRQAKQNSVKSDHTVEDIRKIKPLLTTSKLLVRVNPINSRSEEEINAVIDAGADMVMLPMWKSVEEVQEFLYYINRRTKNCLLLETKESVNIIDDILKLKGIDNIHVGLNDLHLSYQKDFMFELLTDGTVEKICNKIKKKHIPYGFGGIARLNEGNLPACYIIAEHHRLGSTQAIISRTFCDTTDKNYDLAEIKKQFKIGIEEIKEYEKELEHKDCLFYQKNFKIIEEKVEKIVKCIKEKE